MQNTYYKYYNLLLLGAISFSALACSNATADDEAEKAYELIRINQLGFYPEGPKVAVIAAATDDNAFHVLSVDDTDTLYTGNLSGERTSPYSGKTTRIAHFSDFKQPGSYKLHVAGLGNSYSFSIREKIYEKLAQASVEGFYLQRMSVELPEKYAGQWARAAGHPDTVVVIHASAASEDRPEGSTIAAPKGWYDAGDYNKYIVNSGITMGTLLSAYEDFPAFANDFSLNIPEQDNDLPDLLDEVLYNLRWMQAMQDPADGGVYHKLTTADFEGMVMPEEATNTRYVVKKTTAATLDFAAVMAQAARVYANFDAQLPGLADSCLQVATSAWKWAEKNPAVLYDQPAMNEDFSPAITTGAYGDGDVSDEFIWAAAELWISTGDEQYREHIKPMGEDEQMPLPSWAQVRSLAYYSLLRHQQTWKENEPEMLKSMKSQLKTMADGLMENHQENAYATIMGGREKDFVWGSSAVAANQGIALLQAYKMFDDKKYLEAALSNLDYLLGRNATGYSFVTGYGHKTPMFIHHRPSEADDNEEPVPGLLSGGPNPGQQDECDYPSDAADESFVDAECSYASNEIAINWNAPLVYLAMAIESYHQQDNKK